MTRAWMPLYIGDYLRDTAHLSAAEHGAYLLLIMHYWQQGELPTEDKRLARIARMAPAEWDESRETLAEFFAEGWKHERIDAELKAAAENSEKARSKANKRWKRDDAPADPPPADPPPKPEDLPGQMPQHVPGQCPSPSPVEPNGSPDDSARAAHRLPRDFRLTEADRQFAVEHGWSEGEIDDGESEFVDFWSNPKLPASKALKLDWSAVWRNRVRDLGKRRGNGARPPANVTRFGGRNVPETRDANLAATALHQWSLAEDERDRGTPLLQIGRG